VVTALGNVGTFLYESGSALIQGFWDGLKSVWNTVVRWVEDSMAWLRGFWPFSPAKRGAFAGRGYVTHSGKALMGDFADSLRKNGGQVFNAAESVLGDVHGLFNEPIEAQILTSVSGAIDQSALSGNYSESIAASVEAPDFGRDDDRLIEAIAGLSFNVDGQNLARVTNKNNRRLNRRG
jgi:hypothetical protein